MQPILVLSHTVPEFNELTFFLKQPFSLFEDPLLSHNKFSLLLDFSLLSRLFEGVIILTDLGGHHLFSLFVWGAQLSLFETHLAQVIAIP
jgi:hypothetical protein